MLCFHTRSFPCHTASGSTLHSISFPLVNAGSPAMRPQERGGYLSDDQRGFRRQSECSVGITRFTMQQPPPSRGLQRRSLFHDVDVHQDPALRPSPHNNAVVGRAQQAYSRADVRGPVGILVAIGLSAFLGRNWDSLTCEWTAVMQVALSSTRHTCLQTDDLLETLWNTSQISSCTFSWSSRSCG